ncbi:MAG: (Fe-S)-binding protein [Candidatus Abyssobacteria bacterium SURF_5]|uniref:(Fe-S)-binding protein n=1 Tax=Abyssobacteria bacterium (strain SURF_5) TaxID=2093360 RepID=A0A3A4P171_ABYX5|nr:MAG: (Fe-S)-binding protein [Candidatus Abyssubacteria bacterium SURF_5]
MRNVSLFVPCLVDLFMPEVGEDCITLLRHLDIHPIYHAEQTCCGQPAITAGYRKQAKEAARHFISVFEHDEAIVCPSGSCVHTVRRHYPDLFADEPRWRSRAEQLAPRVYELSQYLVDVLGVEDIGGVHAAKVAYHASCQLLHGLGVTEQPKKLIRSVDGAQLVEMRGSEKCCGFGGAFAVAYPDISEAMVSEKVAHYLESGADVLVACDPGCLLNIGGYLSRRHSDRKAIHLASFLANAVRNGKV